MALVVEDGSKVTGANSYNTEAEIVAYAAMFGVTVTTADAEKYVLRNRSYFDSQNYQGTQVSYGVQALPFPRNYVYLENNLLAYTAIPALLKKAEAEGALLLAQGYDLQGTVTTANYIKEKSFASFKKVYSDNAVDTNIYPRLNALLDPLLEENHGAHFRVDRSYG